MLPIDVFAYMLPIDVFVYMLPIDVFVYMLPIDVFIYMLPIDGPTAEPIGLNFFEGTLEYPGGYIG